MRRTLLCLFATGMLILPSITAGRQTDSSKTAAKSLPPSRIVAVANCLMTSPHVQEDLRTLGLKLGDNAPMRFRIGSLLGTASTTGVNIAIYSNDDKRGWLFLVDSNNKGGFTVIRNAYRLARDSQKWQADEGNGGMWTYEEVSRYAESLFSNRRYIIRLTASKANCFVE